MRWLDRGDRLWDACGKAFSGKGAIAWIILLGLLFWLGQQCMIQHPRPESADGLYNLYKPLCYLVPFLMGWFVFSHDEVQHGLPA